MPAHQALYRKYRPKTFDEVIGQEHITKTLINQIKTDTISHAYLFTGTRGTGKTSTAKIFAKAINCLNNNNGSPCLECEVCKALNNNSNLDVLEIDAASNNRVDEIRDLREKIKYPPVNGKYKVYIIDEVHMLTDSAYNALLKTLEEPPKHAVFILATTEVHKLPKTILSRCMRFDFRLVSVEDLVKILKKIFEENNIEYENEALNLIAQKGEGSVRDTLSIADLCVSYSNNKVTYKSVLESLGSTSTDMLICISKALANNDASNLLINLNQLFNTGKNLSLLVKELINFHKDLLTIKCVKNANELLQCPNDIFIKTSNVADCYSKEKLIKVMESLINIETQVKYSINPKTLIEITLLENIDINEEKVSTEVQPTTTDFNKVSFKDSTDIYVKKNDNTLLSKEEYDKEESVNHININDSQKEKPEILNKEINPKTVMATLLKSLRENRYNVILTSIQNFKNYEIKQDNLIISFENNIFQADLENSNNIKVVNDIIKCYNLTVKYVFSNNKENFEDILKNKFDNLKIE